MFSPALHKVMSAFCCQHWMVLFICRRKATKENKVFQFPVVCFHANFFFVSYHSLCGRQPRQKNGIMLLFHQQSPDACWESCLLLLFFHHKAHTAKDQLVSELFLCSFQLFWRLYTHYCALFTLGRACSNKCTHIPGGKSFHAKLPPLCSMKSQQTAAGFPQSSLAFKC